MNKKKNMFGDIITLLCAMVYCNLFFLFSTDSLAHKVTFFVQKITLLEFVTNFWQMFSLVLCVCSVYEAMII